MAFTALENADQGGERPTRSWVVDGGVEIRGLPVRSNPAGSEEKGKPLPYEDMYRGVCWVGWMLFVPASRQLNVPNKPSRTLADTYAR